MKKLSLILALFATHATFALNLNCQNQDGSFQLIQTKPCDKCNPSAPAYSFIGGGDILSDGIPAYEADMPGYISFDKKKSASAHQDVISLIDGGTWWIEVSLPEGFLKSAHQSGTTVSATISSTYSDIMESELNDIELTCTVL